MFEIDTCLKLGKNKRKSRTTDMGSLVLFIVSINMKINNNF